MKSFLVIASLAVSANAFVGRSDSCCFHLTASGNESGSLGQLSDGQVRLGDNTLSAAKFCLSEGVITDSEGRGCVVTSETTQFQCDAASAGTSGFSLSSSGALAFNGSSSFVACATGENNGDNIYTTESDSVTQCASVKLTADSTCAAAASSSSVVSVIPVSTPVPLSTQVPSGSSLVGASYTVSATSSSVLVSTPLAGSSSLVTMTSSTPLASTSTAASTATSPAPSSSSTTAPASSSTAASVATRFELGYLATVIMVLPLAFLYFI